MMTESENNPEPEKTPSASPRSRRQNRNRRRRSHRQENLGAQRHQARIAALQIIYEVDVTSHPLPEVMERTLQDSEEPIIPAVTEYADTLVRGITEHRATIDEYITAAAPAFPIAQLPSVDRNVLRLAVYELLHETDVPYKAVINEAVELAKHYGGMNSSRFVNGVLRTVAAETRQEDSTPATSSNKN